MDLGFSQSFEVKRVLSLGLPGDLIDGITTIHLSQDEVINFAFFVTIWFDH